MGQKPYESVSIEKGSRVDRTLEPFSIYFVIGRLQLICLVGMIDTD